MIIWYWNRRSCKHNYTLCNTVHVQNHVYMYVYWAYTSILLIFYFRDIHLLSTGKWSKTFSIARPARGNTLQVHLVSLEYGGSLLSQFFTQDIVSLVGIDVHQSFPVQYIDFKPHPPPTPTKVQHMNMPLVILYYRLFNHPVLKEVMAYLPL